MCTEIVASEAQVVVGTDLPDATIVLFLGSWLVSARCDRIVIIGFCTSCFLLMVAEDMIWNNCTDIYFCCVHVAYIWQ